MIPSGSGKDVNTYTAPEGTQAELRCSIASLNNGKHQNRSNIETSFNFHNCSTDLEHVDTKWVRANNAPLPENAFVRGGTLYIDNVQESAKGLYSCLGTRRSTGQLLFTLNAYLDVTCKFLTIIICNISFLSMICTPFYMKFLKIHIS